MDIVAVICPKCFHAFKTAHDPEWPFVGCPKCQATIDVPLGRAAPGKSKSSRWFPFAVTGMIGAALGLVAGLFFADVANQRRVAEAQERAGELNAALDEAKNLLAAVPQGPLDDNVVMIGRHDEATVDPALLQRSAAGSLGVNRAQIIRAVGRVFAIETKTVSPVEATITLPDGNAVVSLLGPPDGIQTVNIICAAEGIGALDAGRASAEIARAIFGGPEWYASWLPAALDKCEPGYVVAGVHESVAVRVYEANLEGIDVAMIQFSAITD